MVVGAHADGRNNLPDCTASQLDCRGWHWISEMGALNASAAGLLVARAYWRLACAICGGAAIRAGSLSIVCVCLFVIGVGPQPLTDLTIISEISECACTWGHCLAGGCGREKRESATCSRGCPRPWLVCVWTIWRVIE